MTGGTGNDTFMVDTSLDSVSENSGGGNDEVRASSSYALAASADIEILRTTDSGGTGDLDFTGNAVSQTIEGNAGQNSISGLQGSDMLGGLGGADTLTAGSGHDSLSGNLGADSLTGDSGGDTLHGGIGADTLVGGSSADRFLYTAVEQSPLGNRDVIGDFLTGSDIIDLSAIDANSNLGGNQAFDFIGATAFTGTARELRTFQNAGNTFVAGDTDGDGTGNIQIQLTGLIALADGNFDL
jgi:Ca2+-binding RTX toxin-like protein